MMRRLIVFQFIIGLCLARVPQSNIRFDGNPNATSLHALMSLGSSVVFRGNLDLLEDVPYEYVSCYHFTDDENITHYKKEYWNGHNLRYGKVGVKQPSGKIFITDYSMNGKMFWYKTNPQEPKPSSNTSHLIETDEICSGKEYVFDILFPIRIGTTSITNIRSIPLFPYPFYATEKNDTKLVLKMSIPFACNEEEKAAPRIISCPDLTRLGVVYHENGRSSPVELCFKKKVSFSEFNIRNSKVSHYTKFEFKHLFELLPNIHEYNADQITDFFDLGPLP